VLQSLGARDPHFRRRDRGAMMMFPPQSVRQAGRVENAYRDGQRCEQRRWRQAAGHDRLGEVRHEPVEHGINCKLHEQRNDSPRDHVHRIDAVRDCARKRQHETDQCAAER